MLPLPRFCVENPYAARYNERRTYRASVGAARIAAILRADPAAEYRPRSSDSATLLFRAIIRIYGHNG